VKRWFNNRDDNEPELKLYAEAMGMNVFEGGPLDLWIPWLGGGFLPVEVKNPNGRNRFQSSQEDFMALCDSMGWHYATWRTVDDVGATYTRLRALQALAAKDRAPRTP
jgi:hypothetical protein